MGWRLHEKNCDNFQLSNLLAAHLIICYLMTTRTVNSTYLLVSMWIVIKIMRLCTGIWVTRQSIDPTDIVATVYLKMSYIFEKSSDFDKIFGEDPDRLQVFFAHIFKSIGPILKKLRAKMCFFTFSKMVKNTPMT